MAVWDDLRDAPVTVKVSQHLPYIIHWTVGPALCSLYMWAHCTDGLLFLSRYCVSCTCTWYCSWYRCSFIILYDDPLHSSFSYTTLSYCSTTLTPLIFLCAHTPSRTHLQVLCHAESLKPFSALPVTGKSLLLLVFIHLTFLPPSSDADPLFDWQMKLTFLVCHSHTPIHTTPALPFTSFLSNTSFCTHSDTSSG